MMKSRLQQVIECPDRRELLQVLTDHLVPRVGAAMRRDEKAAGRSLGINPVEFLLLFARWGENAPLVELRALVLFCACSWLTYTLSAGFNEWLLCGHHRAWVEDAIKVIRLWHSDGLMDWPVGPLHPVAKRYKPSELSVVSLVELLTELFITRL